jgi:hypothetical protein
MRPLGTSDVRAALAKQQGSDMRTIPERLTAVETQMTFVVNEITGIGTKVTELHTHFLEKKGAAAERGKRRSVRQMVLVGVSTVVGITAAIIGIAKGLWH